MFVDQAKIFTQSGNGGNGCISFRREKFVPKGGPDGGDGGRGGDIIIEAVTGPTTLQEFRYKPRHIAKNGAPGGGNQCTGKSADNLIIQVPVGTALWDDETGQQVADLTEHGQRFVAAAGGKGGKGNMNYATSRVQAPRKAQPGEPGSSCWLRLELKLLADVGLVGLPNAGKSTLISRISAAKPKIASYPFTTLIPNLGVVPWGEFQSFVMADIPGLIEGAHTGKGLGAQFLRHVERTRCLAYLVDVTGLSDPAPDAALEVLLNELRTHNPAMAERPSLVVATKIDAADEDSLAAAKGWAERQQWPFYTISSVTGDGLKNLVHDLGATVEAARQVPEKVAVDTPAAQDPDIWGE